jgi:hypothetical protein
MIEGLSGIMYTCRALIFRGIWWELLWLYILWYGYILSRLVGFDSTEFN